MIIIFMTINALACVQNNMPSNGVCLPIRLQEVYYCRIVLILFKRLQFVVLKPIFCDFFKFAITRVSMCAYTP